MGYTKHTIKDKEKSFSDFTQSETRFKEIQGLTIVYFVNQYTDSKKEVIVAGIKRSNPHEFVEGIKVIDIEPIKEKSELESEVKTDLEKEGNKMIFW